MSDAKTILLHEFIDKKLSIILCKRLMRGTPMGKVF